MSGPLAESGPWDLVADGYNETTRILLLKYALEAVEVVGISPEHAVLDVAAGPGTLCHELAPQVRRVTALDFSQEMTRICRQGAQDLGLDNVEIVEGDGQSLPFAAEQFDRAFSNFGLMFFPDRLKGMKEIFRTLRPGGKVALTSWQPAESSPGFKMLFGALVETGFIQPQQPSPVKGLDDPEVFRSELEEAGFTDVSVAPISKDLEVSSVEQMWADSVKGTAPILLLKKHLGEKWPEASEKILAHLRANVQPGQAYAMPAWLGTGTKA